MPTRAPCGLQTGMGCPGWPFCRAFPQHAPSTPFRPTPHPSPLAHPQPCSHLPSHLCPRPGTAAKPAAPGCGLQPAGETQGAGATVAADGAPQGEDWGAGFMPSLPPPPMLSWSTPFLIEGGPRPTSVSSSVPSSAWRGTRCGSTLNIAWPPPGTCRPAPGTLLLE